MDASLILLLVCIVAIGFASVTVYFFLRRGGIVEKMAVSKDAQLSSLQSSYLELSAKTVEMEGKITNLTRSFEDLEAKLSRRITAFEARFGKQARVDEKTRLREDALAAIRNQQQ